MQDIQTQAHVKQLIDTFYSKVKKDVTIGFIFNDIIGDNWNQHLPKMYQFWDMVLLSKPGYEGYPTKKHTDIDRKIPLQKEHFDQWLLLWNETIDSLFKGTVATQAKEKAQLMANLISIKVDEGRKGNLIQ
jgi:hemoglobin